MLADLAAWGAGAMTSAAPKDNFQKPLLARCRDATHNASAASLLYRIHFWMPKATIVHGGRKWVANSADQWCEQTALTYDQYRRAIRHLRAKGLVETEQHLFGRKNITHVRLTKLAYAVLFSPQPEKGTAPSPGSDNSTQLEKCKSAQLYIQGDTSLESLHGDTNIAFASAHAESFASEKVDTGKKASKSIQISKIHCSHQNDPNSQNSLGSPQINSQDTDLPNCPSPYSGAPTAVPDEPSGYLMPGSGITSAPNNPPMITPSDLAILWKKVVVEVYEDYVPPLTKKELGQLKTFLDGCPPGQAHSLLELCLREWHGFTTHAKSTYSAFPIPDRPTFDFLLKHRTAAINFAIEKSKPKSQPATVAFGTNHKQPVSYPPKPPPKPEDLPATKEEVLAINASKDDSEAPPSNEIEWNEGVAELEQYINSKLQKNEIE